MINAPLHHFSTKNYVKSEILHGILSNFFYYVIRNFTCNTKQLILKIPSLNNSTAHCTLYASVVAAKGALIFKLSKEL